MKKIIAFFLLMFSSLVAQAQIYGLNFTAYSRYNGSVLSSGTVPNLNFDWGGGTILNTGWAEQVQVYFNGYIKWPGISGTQKTVTFYSRNDDGFYLNINNTNVINSWWDQGPGYWNGAGSITLTAGEVYQIEVWWYEAGGGAVAQLFWDIGNGVEIVPQAVLSVESTTFAPSYYSEITESQTTILNAARNRTNNISRGNSIYIDQRIGSANNSVTIEQDSSYNRIGGLNGSQYAIINGSNNTLNIKQGDPSDLTGKNLLEFSITGNNNNIGLRQGVTTVNGVDTKDGIESGNHYMRLNLAGSNNTVNLRQANQGGANSGHFADLTVSGDYNNLGLKQLHNGDKKSFLSVSGSYNVFDITQQGAGNHYLDLSLSGNGHNVSINQKDSGTHKATISLTNAGGATNLNLVQQGTSNQMYNITQQCANLNGCSVSVTQGTGP